MLIAVACGPPQATPGPADEAGSAPPGARDSAGPTQAAGRRRSGPASDFARLGDGFLVWESNRSGDWRIWTRELDGTGLSRLTPDEQGRDHCCPHISPDGRWVAYMSVAGRDREYDQQGTVGELRLIPAPASGGPPRAEAGGGGRVVARAAQTYFENRAVVWRDPGELVFIDGEAYTALADIETGAIERLTRGPHPRPGRGWLLDPTLRWAVDGSVAFAPYDRDRRTVAARRALGGCQPYFSGDGRWGYWMAGAGGPIERLDPATGERTTLLRKNDPRLPPGIGYMYFPMTSRDGMLLAFAASATEHDHFRADYEVFVVETDPRTLEPLGQPIRYTDDPATDRFPDVHLAPLALGRHFGEAPVTLRLAAPDGGAWEWSFGDGAASVRGPAAEHTFERPGAYAVVARQGGEVREGRVVVTEARPPRVLQAALAEAGGEIRVRFDEEIAIGQPEVRLASGHGVASWEVEPDARGLVIRLAEPLRRFDTLHLAGLTDRAQPPNRLPPTALELEPPLWPSHREALAFLWASGDAANLLPDPGGGAERSVAVTARGRAVLDRDFAMSLAGGSFVATPEDAARVARATEAANEMSIEALIAPAARPAGFAPIVSSASRRLNFRLGQRGERLLFSVRVGSEHSPEVSLAPLPTGRETHVVLTYTPGRLTMYLDGQQAAETDEIQGDFFQFRDAPLVFGGGAEGESWRGALAAVAVYARVLSSAEIAENHLRLRRALARRPAVAAVEVEATLSACSPAPALAEITPYREALAICTASVEQSLTGEAPGPELRVARWVILDGAEQPEARAATGERVRLRLEPFAANPQLESVYVSDTVGRPELPLFYDPLLPAPEG